MAPLAAVAETLGYTVASGDGGVVLSGDGRTISLVVGKRKSN
jgi:hypothetical protein